MRIFLGKYEESDPVKGSKDCSKNLFEDRVIKEDRLQEDEEFCEAEQSDRG